MHSREKHSVYFSISFFLTKIIRVLRGRICVSNGEEKKCPNELSRECIPEIAHVEIIVPFFFLLLQFTTKNAGETITFVVAHENSCISFLLNILLTVLGNDVTFEKCNENERK